MPTSQDDKHWGGNQKKNADLPICSLVHVLRQGVYKLSPLICWAQWGLRNANGNLLFLSNMKKLTFVWGLGIRQRLGLRGRPFDLNQVNVSIDF